MEKVTLVSAHNGFYSLDDKASAQSLAYRDSSSTQYGVSYIGSSSNYLASFQSNKSVLHIWNNKSEPTYLSLIHI